MNDFELILCSEMKISTSQNSVFVFNVFRHCRLFEKSMFVFETGQTIEPSVFNFIVPRHFDELKDKEFVIIPMQNDLDRKIKFGENVDKNVDFA